METDEIRHMASGEGISTETNRPRIGNVTLITGHRARKLGMALLLSEDYDKRGSVSPEPCFAVTDDPKFGNRLRTVMTPLLMYGWSEFKKLFDDLYSSGRHTRNHARLLLDEPNERNGDVRKLYVNCRHYSIRTIMLFQDLPPKRFMPEIYFHADLAIFSLPRRLYGPSSEIRSNRNIRFYSPGLKLTEALQNDECLKKQLFANRKSPLPAGCIYFDSDWKWFPLELPTRPTSRERTHRAEWLEETKRAWRHVDSK